MSYGQYSHDLAVWRVLRLAHRQVSRLAQSGSEMSIQQCRWIRLSVESFCFDIVWARLELRVGVDNSLVPQHLLLVAQAHVDCGIGLEFDDCFCFDVVSARLKLRVDDDDPLVSLRLHEQPTYHYVGSSWSQSFQSFQDWV